MKDQAGLFCSMGQVIEELYVGRDMVKMHNIVSVIIFDCKVMVMEECTYNTSDT